VHLEHSRQADWSQRVGNAITVGIKSNKELPCVVHVPTIRPQVNEDQIT